MIQIERFGIGCTVCGRLLRETENHRWGVSINHQFADVLKHRGSTFGNRCNGINEAVEVNFGEGSA